MAKSFGKTYAREMKSTCLQADDIATQIWCQATDWSKIQDDSNDATGVASTATIHQETQSTAESLDAGTPGPVGDPIQGPQYPVPDPQQGFPDASNGTADPSEGPTQGPGPDPQLGSPDANTTGPLQNQQ